MKDRHYTEKEWDSMNMTDALPQPGEMYVGDGGDDEFKRIACETVVVGSFSTSPNLMKHKGDLTVDDVLHMHEAHEYPTGHALWMRTINGDVHFILLHEDQMQTIVNYWMVEQMDRVQEKLNAGAYPEAETSMIDHILREGRKLIEEENERLHEEGDEQ